MKPVTIYSTPTCTYCNSAKDFFKENNVTYVEYNVAADLAKRKEMVEKSGQLGVPVIEIGEDITVGFDRTRLAQQLGIK
jgi:glutaredoxin-like YruB-family protein